MVMPLRTISKLSFEHPTSGDNKPTDEEICEADIAVLQSGGQNSNYQRR